MSLTPYPTSSAISMTSVITTVVWLVFAAAGVLGLCLQYEQAQAPRKEKPTVIAEHLDVQIVGASANAVPKPDSSALPNKPQEPTPTPLPVLPAVAAPSLTIPFSVPSKPVMKNVAAPSKTVPLPTAVDPVQHLTFGAGEGDQPPPEYPREAKIARQQGTVVVRFNIDDDGNVTDAEASSPSPYALLNQAAVRKVRESWHFPSGKPRVCDITFQFELHQK